MLALHILHALLPDATPLHIDQFEFEIPFPAGFQQHSELSIGWIREDFDPVAQILFQQADAPNGHIEDRV